MYAGNSVIVNLFMRWPALVPVAAAVGIYVVVPKEVPPAAPLQPPVVEVVVPPPVVVESPKLKMIETLCPPEKDTAKLSKKDKKAQTDNGCKVRG